MLYVAKNLAYVEMIAQPDPPVALWVSPADGGKSRVYYRLTPRVLAWVLANIDAVDRKALAGELKPEIVASLQERLEAILAYANAEFDPADIRVAIAAAEWLPDAAEVEAEGEWYGFLNPHTLHAGPS